MKKIVIFGAGGHSLVIIDLIKELNEYTIVGIYDDNKDGDFDGIPILGQIDDNIIENADEYIIGIGDDKIRKKIYEQFSNLPWATLIHPKSIVSKNTRINEGSVILAGAIIQAGVSIGKHCIINSFSSICPGVTICGNVNIGELTFIGANSTIIQRITVGNNCIVGAGSVIIKNVNNNCKIVGNPGRIIQVS